MKKRMRKAVAIAATAAMVGSLPAGAVTAQAADDDITIGVSIWSSTGMETILILRKMSFAFWKY